MASKDPVLLNSIKYLSKLPAHESLEPLEQASLKASRSQRGFTMICQSIGHQRRGKYINGQGKKKSKTVPVGFKKSDCYGRCGAGCGQSKQYTQECLNHDICNRETGENLGVCSDEFWAASDGWFNAPNCQNASRTTPPPSS